MNLKEKLDQVPREPGVYIMRNEANQIIYVGKAKNLRNRIRQYFGSYGKSYQKVKAMVSHIADFEYIIVRNEVESLILESNLIKENHPKYNILLRDDKQYPYIKVTVNEQYPRVMKTRRILKDGAKYFGPYPNALAVNDVIDVLQDIYKIRNCNLDMEKSMGKVRPCLNYFIDRCVAPCLGNVDPEDYGKMIDEILAYLNGTNRRLIEHLEQKMKNYSKDLKFERAAKVRDQIQALELLLEKQVITLAASNEEFDIINLARGDGEVCVQIFFYRQGRIMGREHFILEDPYRDDEEDILRAFITQFYHGLTYVPSKLLIPVHLKDEKVIEEWLTEKQGRSVKFHLPQRGEKKKLLEMVKHNAIDMLDKYSSQYHKKAQRREQALEELQDVMGLDEKPIRIEAYDISNISGVESVGSMVVFENGKVKKNDYRKFRIKTVVGADDYASLREVLMRRFTRGLNEQAQEKEKAITSFSFFPDLIMMDGGKGQVNMAKEVLSSLGIDINVCGLVKDDRHITRGIIYNNEEIILDRDSKGYKLIYQIQEEAHRFAINYHRKLRSKASFKSELDDIDQIGPVRKKNLMRHFKSIERIKKASVEELMTVESMNKRAAISLYSHFNKE